MPVVVEGHQSVPGGEEGSKPRGCEQLGHVGGEMTGAFRTGSAASSATGTVGSTDLQLR